MAKQPYFKVKKGSKGQFKLSFYGANNELVFSGELCHNHKDVMDTLEMIRREAPTAKLIDQTLEA